MAVRDGVAGHGWRRGRHLLLALLFAGVLVAPLPRATTESVAAMYPRPGTDTADPRTTISFRGDSAGGIGEVQVAGTASGVHTGILRSHRDDRGVTFVPDRQFSPGERVAVSTTADAPDAPPATFRVAVPAATPAGGGSPMPTPDGPARTTAFASAPEVVAPVVTVSGQPVDGLLLSTPATTTTTPRAVMVNDHQGRLVWWRSAAERSAGALFRSEWKGVPVLAWFEGDMPLSPGWFRGEWLLVDPTYREVARIRAGNGLHADIHDLQLTGRGTALVVAYQPVVWDASAVGGDSRTVVLDAVVQEVDPDTGDVWFEWHALDHIPLTWSHVGPTPDNVFDYVHINAAVMDAAGDVLITLRHMSIVAEIDRDTGQLNWVLGGRHPTVAVTGGRAPSFPHHARWLPDGTLSVFDNGVGAATEHSRGVVYDLDKAAHTARLVAEYTADPPLFTATQGSLEHHADGTALASWGELGSATLFADGEPVGDIDVGAPSYRMVVAEWSGRPATRPAAVVRDGQVHVSWNGATEVAAWQLLTGEDADRLQVAVERPRRGFETRLPLAPVGAAPGASARVEALDAAGDVIGRSALLTLPSLGADAAR